jgi:hypothetical protein
MKPSAERAFAMRTTSEAAFATPSSVSPTTSPSRTIRGRPWRLAFVV